MLTTEILEQAHNEAVELELDGEDFDEYIQDAYNNLMYDN